MLIFLKDISSNRSLIPLKFFPYCILVRLSLQDGQLHGLEINQSKMILLWYLIIEILVKNILVDNFYRRNGPNNENINR